MTQLHFERPQSRNRWEMVTGPLLSARKALATLAMVGTALAMALAPTSASADPYRYGVYGHRGYAPVYLGAPRFYGPGHRGFYRGAYRGHRGRFGYRHYRRGGLSGGEAALIAAGVIGGAILIDRAFEQRRYDDYDRAYDRYTRSSGRYRRGGAWDDDYYYQRDDRFGDRRFDDRFDNRPEFDESEGLYRRDERSRQEPNTGETDEDYGLLGDVAPSAQPRRILAAGEPTPEYPRFAYQECLAETRGAAGAGGMMVALPAMPTQTERLADGSVRMTAVFTARNARGQEWQRVMTCEADDGGVSFLELG